MECLNCKKEFQPKRDSAKYCSDNCRVRFYLKKVKIAKEQKPPLTFQVILNRMENVLEKIESRQSLPQYDAPKTERIFSDEPPKWEQPEITGKSVHQHLKEIANLDTPYEYEQKAKEIEYDPNLTDKERKDLLLNIKLPKN